MLPVAVMVECHEEAWFDSGFSPRDLVDELKSHG